MIAQRNERDGSVAVWRGTAEAEYERWRIADPDDPVPQPDPSFVLSLEECTKLVVEVLRGYGGPAGPMGPAGVSGTP